MRTFVHPHQHVLYESNHTHDILHYCYMCILSAKLLTQYYLQFHSPIPMASTRFTELLFFHLVHGQSLKKKKELIKHTECSDVLVLCE